MFIKNLQPNRTQLIAMILLISVSFSACGSQQPDQPITDITWQWSELVEAEPASQSIVPDPENYTLLLSPDGSVNIKADCNMVGGSYSLDGSGLTIELGPSTMAFCGEDSLDQLYLGLLSSVESYTIEDGRLILAFQDGAGRMTFYEG
jgi:heat shock protein HslJ